MVETINGRKTKTVTIIPAAHRLMIGVFGASIAAAPPLWTRLATSQLEAKPILSIVTGIDVALVIAWLASIYLAWVIEEDEFYKPLMTSLGIPGLLVSASVGFQSVS